MKKRKGREHIDTSVEKECMTVTMYGGCDKVVDKAVVIKKGDFITVDESSVTLPLCMILGVIIRR